MVVRLMLSNEKERGKKKKKKKVKEKSENIYLIKRQIKMLLKYFLLILLTYTCLHESEDTLCAKSASKGVIIPF